MSAGSVLLAAVRVHLEEETENEFKDDEQLYPYISRGQRFVAAKLASIEGAGWFEKESTVTVSANAESANLPSDFVRMKLCEWLDANSVRHSIRPIPYSKVTQMRAVSSVAGDVPPAYFLLQNTIHVLPISSSSRTLKLIHEYEPAVVDAAVDSLETPDRYDHVVALFAAISALADDGGRRNDVWLTMLDGFVADMVQRETQRMDRGHGQSVEMVYTSDQW